MESMSNTPYYLPKARGGLRYGNGEIIDGIVKDGLFDVYNEYLMGNCAELIASDLKLTREDQVSPKQSFPPPLIKLDSIFFFLPDHQDTFALSSYARAQSAQKNGSFDAEIIPVEVPGARGAKPTIVTVDEESSKVNFAI